MHSTGKAQRGFTLIELSIVLVVIGLVVGGVLVGQDLIRAAGVRATISQIEEFNTAANTFYGKYAYLPGDIPATPAAQYGLVARGPNAGEGDGNGLLQGIYGLSLGQAAGVDESAGETVVFWVDLSTVNLIKGGFNSASASVFPTVTLTGSAIDTFLPAAKLGRGNYIYTWGLDNPGYGILGTNFFGLSGVSSIAPNSDVVSNPDLTVLEAYNIDKKIDDGLPQSGRILAIYVNGSNGVEWASGGGTAGAYPWGSASPSSTTCYDDGGSTSNPMAYSLTQNSGNGVNCALSFRMQAGD